MRIKLSSSQVLVLVFALALGVACNRPPDLPIEPEVSFSNIEFEVRNAGDPLFEENILRLSINVKDGDGDLGLDGDEDFGPYAPYHLVLENNQPVEFGQRPNDPPFTCLDYIIEDRENQDINGDNDLLDTLLIDFNRNQYNIEVDFFVKRNGTFQEVDLRAQPRGSANESTLCGISFDGRFPCLSSEENPFAVVRNNKRPIEGVITYDMKSGIFLPIFRTDTLKLQFIIRDRALHTSNVGETPEFTLQGIRVER